MKAIEKKGFGIVGVSIELSFIELMAIDQLRSRLIEEQRALYPEVSINVNMAISFFNRLSPLAINEEVEKAWEGLFGNAHEDQEDLKNEADINALENETYQ